MRQDVRTLLIGAGVGAAVGVMYSLMSGAGWSITTPGKLPPSRLLPSGGGFVSPKSFAPTGSSGVGPADLSSGEAFFASLAEAERSGMPDSTRPNVVARSQMIYDAIKNGGGDNLGFTDVSLSWNGHTGNIYVLSDALTMFGVRVNVNQFFGQLITDYFGCIAMTRKVADAVWRAATYKPTPSVYAELNKFEPMYPISTPAGSLVLRANLLDMASTTAMLRHSAACDSKLAALGVVVGSSAWSDGLLRANMGKDWLLNSWFWRGGNNSGTCGDKGMTGTVLNLNSSVNYGWFQSNGVVIQPAGNCHGFDHTDYSQPLRFMAGKMLVDGVEMNTADVLVDPQFAGLLVDEPSLPGWRHPGVPVDSGAVV